MVKTYLKTLGEILAKKVGPKALGTGGRIAGRVAAVGAIAWSTYEFFSTLNKNIKNEPAFQEMVKYKQEFEKWSSAVSCIGREPYTQGALGSLDEGGCINALSKKKTLNLGGRQSSKQDTIMPDPKLAKELLERAIDYIAKTENLAGDENFEEQKENLVEKLRDLNNQIKCPYQPNIDYSPIQEELSEIVKSIKPINSDYRTKIYRCQAKLQETMPRNAGWAMASTLTMGLVKKKKKTT